MKNIEKIEETLSGSGGCVYKVYKKVIYALKEIIIISKSNHKDLQRFLNEYEKMNMPNHPGAAFTKCSKELINECLKVKSKDHPSFSIILKNMKN